MASTTLSATPSSVVRTCMRGLVAGLLASAVLLGALVAGVVAVGLSMAGHLGRLASELLVPALPGRRLRPALVPRRRLDYWSPDRSA